MRCRSSGGKSNEAAPSASTNRRASASRLQARGSDIHHRAADELRDEEVGGVLVDVGRRADLLQHALVHDGDAVGERHGLHLIVRHIDGCLLVLQMQPLQLGAHLLAQLGVERADRLVHQHGLRMPDERAADGDALHVAARERGGPPVEEMLDLQCLRRLADLGIDGGAALARGAKREGDVVVGGQMRIEREKLEDEGDVAVAGLQRLHRLAVDQDVAGVDILKARNCAQRGRLAAARRSEENDEFLVGDRKVQLPDDVIVAEIFLDVAQDDLGHGAIAAPRRNRA